VRRIGRFHVCDCLRAVRVLATMGLAACGSQGGEYGEPALGQIGFVGSGGNERFDGGVPPSSDGGAGDGAAGNDAGTGPRGSDSGDLEDAGSGNEGSSDGGSNVGIVLNLPPGFFASLDWVIEGPAGSYSGTVQFGGARSLEFVVGGIKAGDGYAITLTGIDAYGQPCSGTSSKFSVSPGATTGAGVLIECDTGDGAVATPVSTGNVQIEAGVAMTSP